MFNQFRRIKRQIRNLAQQETESKSFPAWLGDPSGTILTGKQGIVYVTKWNGEVIQVLNRKVPNKPSHVIVGYDPDMPGVLQILSKRDVFGSVDTTPQLPDHDHNFFQSHNPTFVDAAQFKPLLVLPVSTFTVQIFGGAIQISGGTAVLVTNQQLDLSSYIPTTGAKYVVIEADDTGAINVVEGSTITSVYDLTVSDIPTWTGSALCAIRLYDVQTEIQRNRNINDFYDLRAFAGKSVTGLVHNNLYGLQGGSQALDEFYHLTGSQHAALVGGSATYADLWHTHDITSSWDGDITDIDETSSTDIGEAINDSDQGIIFNQSAGGGAGAWVRFAWSRVLSYVTSYLGISWLLDEDNMATDSALRPPSQQSVKAYTDFRWIPYTSVTPTRSSANDPIFVLEFASVDLTDDIGVGMFIRLTQNSTIRYGIVHAIELSGSDTLITIFGGTDYDIEDTSTYPITEFYYTPSKAPIGFPLDREIWSHVATDTTDRSTTPSGTTWYNLGSFQITFPIGQWKDVQYQVAIYGHKSTAGLIQLQTTLSTSTSSVSDSDFNYGVAVNPATDYTITVRNLPKTLDIASPTTYYLLTRVSSGSCDSLYNFNSSVTPAAIKAYSSYI